MDIRALKEEWVYRILDAVDENGLYDMARTYLENEMDTLTDEEFINQVNDIDPDWLDDWDN